MASTNTIYAAELNLEIKQGDSSIIEVTFTDPNSAGDPLDLTTFTDLKMQVKAVKADALPIFELTNQLGISGTNNEVLTIPLSATNTNLYPSDYYYDIQGLQGSEVRTILEGIIQVSGDVTR